MTWSEEIPLLAGDYGPGFSEYLLFANAETFYLYKFDGDSLFRGGNTLKEVYYGLLQWRWPDEYEPQEMWTFEPDNEEEYDSYDYFPFWRHGFDENGQETQVLSYSLLSFIPRRVGSDVDSGYVSGLNSEGEE